MRSRVREAARELGLDIELRTLGDSTATSQQAAVAIGCDVAQIAKAIVFVCDGEPVVCIASGAHRIDPGKVCEALDCAEVRQASPAEVRAATGFPVGGVPPFGHGLPVVFDQVLLDHAVIWAAGGDGNTLFQVAPRTLAGAVHALVAPVGQ